MTLRTASILWTCILLFAVNLFPQTQNTVDNDGTTNPFWYVGYDSTAKLGVGVDHAEAISRMLTVRDSGTVGSQTFISGWLAGSGWGIDVDTLKRYHLTVDDITVRGSLAVYELLLNQIRATNGNLLITSAATIDSVAKNKESFYTVDVSENNICPFVTGDIILSQGTSISGVTFDSTGAVVNNGYLVKRLVFKVDSTSGRRVYYSLAPGAPSSKGEVRKGDVFCRIGNLYNADRMGSIGLFADDDKSPYIRVIDSVNSYADFSNPASVKVQLGKLTGIYDPAFGGQLEGYGLYSDNAYIKGKIVVTNPEDFDLEMVWDSLTNKPAYFNAPSGAGLFISGSNLGYYDASTYPSDPWRTYMDNQGRFYLKGSGNNYLSWNGGSLTMRGDGNQLDISSNTSISNINSTITTHGTSINNNANAITLRAYTYTTDSLRNRLTGAEGSITTHTSQIGSLQSTVAIKANVTTTDSLRGRMNTAEAGIVANANNISGVSSSLLLYAKKDSIISKINLSPESIDIDASRITISGATTFASDDYNPSLKTSDNEVTTIIGNTVNAPYINSLSIKADSVESSWIYAGAISANQITSLGNITATGTITGGTLSGSAITGATITGGTVQTATAGSGNRRVVISESEMGNVKFYKSNDAVMGYIQTVQGTPDDMLDITSTDVLGLYAVDEIRMKSETKFDDNITKINGVTTSFPSSQGSSNTYLKNDGSGNLSWAAISGGSGGTVTSVGLSMPNIFTVSGSPITTTGTLSATLASQSQNKFLGSPNGSTGTPSFRGLESTDIPSLDASKITSGTIASARLSGNYGINISGEANKAYAVYNMTGQTAYDADYFGSTLAVSGNNVLLNTVSGSQRSSITVPYATTAGTVNASNITQGTLANARLTGSSTTFGGFYELSSGNWYSLTFSNGSASSYTNIGAGDTWSGTIYVDTNGDGTNETEVLVVNGIMKNP